MIPSTNQTDTHVLAQLFGIHKYFPGVHALKGVDFQLYRGEIHALVGENGAGKSTLMHILAGVYQPDSGSIFFNGNPNTRIENERIAQDLGIAIVYQEKSLVNSLNVAENIFFGRQPVHRWSIINHKLLYEKANAILDQLGLDINPKMLVGRLSPAQQQMVEIAKALSLNAQMVILDEPTSSLTEPEIVSLYRVLRRLKNQGVGIIFISHRLAEVFDITDRVTVLKDGEFRGTYNIDQITPEKIISLMVGRDIKKTQHSTKNNSEVGNVVLEVRSLSDRTKVRDINFYVRSGEILAFAGLAGAGRTEMALALFGASSRQAGEILINHKKVKIQSTEDAIAAGIGYLPEERRDAGLFLQMSISRNISIGNLKRFGTWWLNDREMDSIAEEYRQTLSITSPNVLNLVQNLSGGNQQKVVLAKWLLLKPKILIVDEPTRGIDVGAKAEVHNLLRALAADGTAIILISSELPEILDVADRIMVMREGQISGELTAEEATEEKILRYASTIAEAQYGD